MKLTANQIMNWQRKCVAIERQKTCKLSCYRELEAQPSTYKTLCKQNNINLEDYE